MDPGFKYLVLAMWLWSVGFGWMLSGCGDVHSKQQGPKSEHEVEKREGGKTVEYEIIITPIGDTDEMDQRELDPCSDASRADNRQHGRRFRLMGQGQGSDSS